ncbi:MAG: T9SS type A sorting domain-containing protein [Melioribacteraceae bacterium]|nr:T9SS type A sorting domain-containing protein [Melioribacteraceae bacterium]
MKNFNKIILSQMLICSLFLGVISGQQLSLNRLNKMPDSPGTYDLPDFNKIAIGYDSLIFDLNSSGEYLPAIVINNSTTNYPEHNSFGIHSYIGTIYPDNGETINVLPAVIGATLVGINKLNDRGNNWVLMCEEYFNRRHEENVYLNGPNASSGSDWWYDTMPNVFFYQLNYLYPGTGDFDFQFTQIANQWLESLRNMRAKSTPWQKAIMNYRGWYLSTMTGNANGVIEPEASGAIGWLLYNAYVKTGEEKYRIGAEWAIEFLNSLHENPSYELQLSYGAYIAARMNAELNTGYDLNKILNWCFDVGPLRNWGAVVGKWGNFEANGLIGEINGNNDYAFAMNTFEQIGALAPLVRYDDRYAKSIGKWILNAANSSRLFYSKYLPDFNEDSWRWSKENDPNSYIAYEALREEKNSKTPFATGDAISGGWSVTNLGLYGSSHIGILGGIIKTTNIPKILQLDLLKTDYYHSETYPTYLYYNPYGETKTVTLNLPGGNYDIYESVNNMFIYSSVSTSTDLQIEANSAIIVVLAPSGGTVSYNLNKTLINDRIIDYNNGKTISNYPPRIKALANKDSVVFVNTNIPIYCTAVDVDGYKISYSWEIEGESISKDSSVINWLTPNKSGTYKITSFVSDELGGSDTSALFIEVVEKIVEPPKIEKMKATPLKINLGNETVIECVVQNQNNNDLVFEWFSLHGSIKGSGESITWTAPTDEGDYFIRCTVTNSDGIYTADSIKVMVRDFTIQEKGNLITYYSFSGNANDESGNNLHGILNGPKYTQDRYGNFTEALLFDGEDDNVTVANSNKLNFINGISVNFWIYINEFYDRESYPISHGNWENRWKASITNNKLRWTIKTSSGIVDLDSETILESKKWCFVSLQYDGDDVELYINNSLDSFTHWTGTLNTTSIDLTIGQAMPTNKEYNFNGKLDDIRIFDYALSVGEIGNLFNLNTSIYDEAEVILPTNSLLKQNFPNPFNGQTHINFYLKSDSFIELLIYDVLGKEVRSLIAKEMSSGWYDLTWDSKDDKGRCLASGVYLYRIKTNDFIQTKKMLLLQ